MLSPEIVVALRAELERLMKQRRTIDDNIQSILALLGPLVTAPSEAAALAGITTQASQEFLAGKTVKQLVKDVLRERPGVKSAAVTKILMQRGFVPGGSTRITHRVYNEIWRMVQNGEAIKTELGGFRLTEKGEKA